MKTISKRIQTPLERATNSVDKSNLKKTLIEMFCTFFYIGKFPIAPGTFGTLAAMPLSFLVSFGGNLFYALSTVVFVIVSIFVCEAYEKHFQVHDSGQVVVDEVAGYLITMALIPLTPQALILGFLLFRFLDILKPSLIGVLDQKIKGGLGVMADDILAGLIANVVLQILYFQTDFLTKKISIFAGGF